MILRILLLVVLAACCEHAAAQPKSAGPRFEIAFLSSVHPQPITGRLFLMISRKSEPEVRLQSTWFNSPEMVALNVKGLAPQQPAVIDSQALGTPLSSLEDLPPGEYYVQAVLSVYTEFHRADGHLILAHMDHWEGQQFNRSPGNLFSRVEKLHIDAGKTYRLTLTEVIPPVQPPADTQWVKYIRIQSNLLTKFWGQPIYIGAVVLLPRDYASTPTERYPVIYAPSGHFSLTAPFGFETTAAPESDDYRQAREAAGIETGYDLYQSWQSEHFPRIVAVSILDPTPFGDWSGGVNSPNIGPYGNAIITELIPYIETRFRIVSEPYARVLTGRASAGREALALQLYHPDFFGGAWIFEPWPFNFASYLGVNLYKDDNAYRVAPSDMPFWARNPSGWLPVERYVVRTGAGIPFATFRQLGRHDAVMASMAGGDCIGIDDSIVGPIGSDGYPKPLWDRTTGKIDHEVADYWREHGDLAYYAQTNWPKIGPLLTDKLHFYVGDMDHFERNEGVHLFEAALKAAQASYSSGTFNYAPFKGDWQPMNNAGLVRLMADHITKNTPVASTH